MFGDFEDLETGEVHHGEGEDDDEDDNNNEEEEDGGNERELLFLLQKKIHQWKKTSYLLCGTLMKILKN